MDVALFDYGNNHICTRKNLWYYRVIKNDRKRNLYEYKIRLFQMLYLMILINIICLAYFAYKDHKHKKLKTDYLIYFILINAVYSLIIKDFPMLIFILASLSVFELFNLPKFLENKTSIGEGDFYLVLALLPTCGLFIFFVLIISIFLLIPYSIIDIYLKHKKIELGSFMLYRPAYAPVLLGGYILTWLLS